ncbi:putative leucine-rich repeat receptor-like serine/threonine-protein kinase At2g14440 [Carica papaya]|uniref:putative leucine-rich repeat receptor-like serine/threonine-protein kinase At2g14440 n=1 Tax=Carica papaya TaxID=3649 RepID=UPI000B8C6FD8|nr:putative leucine-rich repeat receptor-like serine/threonine-protein kinase At2g14440 [Carica papaya]
MSLSVFLLWLVSIPLLVQSQPVPKGFLLSCGSPSVVTLGNLKYTPDEGFVSVGNSAAVKTSGVLPILSNVRYFPDKVARKYCYNFPVSKGTKYLVRTTYYYGGFDGGKEPPVFDQIIGGTKWSTVNTTTDYANGLSSYYEVIVAAAGKILSVCLARNSRTVSSPFISAIEVQFLDDYVYNSTDFENYALSVVARSTFGSDEDLISYPDDPYNRFWQPFRDQNPVVENKSSVNPSDFWNVPPVKAFASGITTSRGKKLEVKWPLVSLPSTKYYISLYFQDNRSPSPFSWRVFSVSVNGMNFYTDLNVTHKGIMVYSAKWPLSGQTVITMTPNSNSPVGPLINAAEILQIFPLGGRTNTRDVMAMEDLARKIDHLPSDWSGDPCLPTENSWTGVTCSKDKLARVVSLDLTNLGLTGALPPSINNLSALTHLWVGGNRLSGPLPDMSSLKKLRTLHLENNQFTESIPASLTQLPELHELFLQNNKLEGQVPTALQQKSGLKIKVSPENSASAW